MNGKFAWVGGVTNPDTRDAEVEALRAENKRLRENRGWDGDWRTIGQTEEESHRILMTWRKAELVARIQADAQRAVQHEAWLASRVTIAEAERDALQAQLDNMTTEERVKRPRIVGSRPLIMEQRLVGPWVESEGDN